MSFSVRNLVLIVLGASVVAALGYLSLRTDPVPVDLSTVVRGPLQVTVNADGRTSVRDLYEISSPISGTALRSPVEVGDPVFAGETVVAIVRPGTSALLDERTRRQAEATLIEAQATLQLAETQRLRAEKDLEFNQSQLQRTQALVERGVASITQLEDAVQNHAIADATAKAAEAQIELARGQIERAEAALMTPSEGEAASGACCVEIHAPADGVVLSIEMVSQRPVNPGTPLLAVGEPTDLELVVDILSSDGVRLSPGTPAIVERWGGEGTLEARLARIDPAARTKVSALGIEEQRVDAYLDFVTPPERREGLGDGFSVFVRIVEWESDDVLQIPVSALFRDGSTWAAFVSLDGVARQRALRIGHRNTQAAEVLDGLSEGEQVITHPSDQIEDGITIVERSELR